MKGHFTIAESHIRLAHSYWEQIVSPGDCLIDATCGNGHDTLKLCQLTLPSGQVFAIDIQEKAIQSTKQLLSLHLSQMEQITFIHSSHAQFPSSIREGTIKLIVYNLGYLPGGVKEKTTLTATTLESLKNAERLLMPGGFISITCYPGHPEGKKEQELLIDYTSGLDPTKWNPVYHQWLNRNQCPSLLLIQKTALLDNSLLSH